MAMASSDPTAETTLYLKRIFAAPREKVFRVWTKPEEIRQWFAASDEYDTPIAEVDLRVGGKFRMGMKHLPKGTLHIATGVYKEIRPPEKLVFTWSWEGQPESGETVVTIEFRDQGTSTEVIFTHELFPTAALREQHMQGWNGCFDHLAKALQT